MLSVVMCVSSVRRIYFSLFGDLCIFFVIFFLVALWPSEDHGLLIHQVSRSHTATHHSR